jgi:hypothetical protein
LRSKTAKNVILVEAAKMTDSLPMNAKRKAAFSKEAWQAMRARYTWYLRPPFDQEFDRSHRWKNEPRIDPAPPLQDCMNLLAVIRLLVRCDTNSAMRNGMDKNCVPHSLAPLQKERGPKPSMILDRSRRQFIASALLV